MLKQKALVTVWKKTHKHFLLEYVWRHVVQSGLVERSWRILEKIGEERPFWMWMDSWFLSGTVGSNLHMQWPPINIWILGLTPDVFKLRFSWDPFPVSYMGHPQPQHLIVVVLELTFSASTWAGSLNVWIPRPHPRPTESEALGVRPRNLSVLYQVPLESMVLAKIWGPLVYTTHVEHSKINDLRQTVPHNSFHSSFLSNT